MRGARILAARSAAPQISTSPASTATHTPRIVSVSLVSLVSPPLALARASAPLVLPLEPLEPPGGALALALETPNSVALGALVSAGQSPRRSSISPCVVSTPDTHCMSGRDHPHSDSQCNAHLILLQGSTVAVVAVVVLAATGTPSVAVCSMTARGVGALIVVVAVVVADRLTQHAREPAHGCMHIVCC